jgi:hypothetical protein
MQQIIQNSGYITREQLSQFPLWDFFECNCSNDKYAKPSNRNGSQFPLWDFFECNKLYNWDPPTINAILSIPFVGFL